MCQVKSVFFHHALDSIKFEKSWVGIARKALISAKYYVDDCQSPRLYLIINNDSEAIVFGECTDSRVMKCLVNLLQYHQIMIIMADETMTEKLSAASSFSLLRRHCFELVKYAPDMGLTLPNGYTVEPIGLALAQRISSEIDPDFSLYWPIPKDFVDADGDGYCLMRGNTIISCVWSCYPYHQYTDMMVATRRDERNKGFATYLSQYFILSMLFEKRIPCWSCYDNNDAAIYLSYKLGFKKIQNYYFLFPV